MLKIYCSIIWIPIRHAMSISWSFWCKFSFPQVLGFVALDWLWIYQIVKFKRLKYSPLNEEYRAHLTFILALRKGWEKWTKPTWLFFLRHPVCSSVENWFRFSTNRIPNICKKKFFSIRMANSCPIIVYIFEYIRIYNYNYIFKYI